MKVFEIVSEYQDRYPLNKEFSEKLKPLFTDLLIAHNISFLQIETRVKSLPSFLDKVYRVLSAGRVLLQLYGSDRRAVDYVLHGRRLPNSKIDRSEI